MAHLLGRYQIRERIGEGAMAYVHRAYDPNIQRELAIKVLKPELRLNKEYASRFLREAKAAGALSHPNIVTIYDVGVADGYPYIAMELLDGRPLDALMAEQRFSIEMAIKIGIQLAEALRYAHALGVIHRDIKPSNILVGPDGSVKLLDFGIARVAEAVERTQVEGVKTQIGQVLGTPRYMSPEQAFGAELDGRSDLFSVGVVLYELVSGKKAFDGASAATLALQITQGDPTALAHLAPDTPRGLQFIINKLMNKRPERRYADGAQLAEALTREQGVLAALAAEAAGRKRRLSLPARTAMAMAAITAVALCLCIGAVQSRQAAAMRQMALTSGSAISSFVASNAALRAVDNATLPPAERDWLPLQAFIRAASADRNVRSIVVADSDGVVRGASDPNLVGRPYRAVAGEPTVAVRDGVRVTQSAGGEAFRFVRPILYAGQRFGTVDVRLSKQELNAAEQLSEALLALLGLAVVVVVGAGSYVSARAVAQPVSRLKTALRDAAKGDLNFRISHHRRDEFGELFDGFNRLAASMQEQLELAESHGMQNGALAARPVAPPPRQVDPNSPFAAPAAPVARDPMAQSGAQPGPQGDPSLNATRILPA